jgi:hypothetical protein
VAVPSVSTWALDVDQVLAAAMDRLPGGADQGYDIERARRALQFTFQRLLARRVANWKVTEGILTLTAGQAAYSLPADEHDVLEVTVRETTQVTPTDVPLTRMARDEYHLIPDKTTKGRPVNFWLQRGRDNRTLYFWPTPDLSNRYEVRYQRVVLFRDVGTMLDNLDVPTAWTGVMVAGCSYFLSLERGDIDIPTRQELDRLFSTEIELLEGEDADKSPLRVLPDLSAYTGAC